MRLLGPLRRLRRRQLRCLQLILREYNADKKFRGFEDEVLEINKNLELLFLGLDIKSSSKNLSPDTGSLQAICHLNSVMDTLTLMARVQGRRFLRKDLDAQLIELSQGCYKQNLQR